MMVSERHQRMRVLIADLLGGDGANLVGVKATSVLGGQRINEDREVRVTWVALGCATLD